MELHAAIRRLPKAELHVHVIGAIRPSTLISIIEQDGIETPYRNVDDIVNLFRYRDFGHFIDVYKEVVDYITHENYFERIAYEMLEDCARCNTRYVEFSFSSIDHVERGLDFRDMVHNLNKGIKRAAQDFSIESNIRIDLVRNSGPDTAMETLDSIRDYPENIVAIDLGGSEHMVPPKPFAKAYTKAREMGLHLVAHAGEAAGPGSIWDAITHLGVERIGHGVTAIGDSKLLDYMKEHQIAIEACPVSNVRTGVVETLTEHPIWEFYEKGLLVSVNSDDPSFFHTDMNNEFIQLNEHLGFSLGDLFWLTMNAVDSSFLSTEDKKELRKSVRDDYLVVKDKID
jgi:adenosine deaminase